MKTLTLEEFHAEARALFGDPKDWKFVCPACATESTPSDFMAVRGKKEDGNRCGQECIGRVMNDAGDRTEVQVENIRVGEGPCNWAYGLFGTLNGGQRIEMEGGKTMLAFDFAKPDG